MRYAIISDIHGNLEALEAVLEQIDRMEIDTIVCLGDIVGYGASPDECVSLLRERKIPAILGNHDTVVCGLEEPLGFNTFALMAIKHSIGQISEENLSWLRNRPSQLVVNSFLSVHSTLVDFNWEYITSWEKAVPHIQILRQRCHSLCFFGHTHHPGIFADDGAYALNGDNEFIANSGKEYMINPGSVGQPRDEDPRAAFGVYCSEEKKYKLLRIDYDIEKAASRILKSGLPEFLAERLHAGK